MSSPLALPRFASFGTRTPVMSVDPFNQPNYIPMLFEGRQGPNHGFVTFGSTRMDDEGIWNPYAKFEVEEASTRSGFVHLKCCYNHKHLRKASEDPQKFEIAAAADEPEEDTSKWSCTLFRPVWRSAQTNVIAGYELSLNYSGQERRIVGNQANISDTIVNMLLEDGVTTGFTFTRFVVSDLDNLPILPRFVCLKADNDRYLRIEDTGSVTRQATFSSRDRRENEVRFEVIRTRSHRSVVLRPVSFPSSYLARNANNVYEATTRVGDRSNAPLEPVMLNFAGPPAVAFKSLSMANKPFIERRNVDVITDAFATGTPGSILAQAEFLIEETVRSRQLSNIQFYYDDMNILEPTPVAVLTKKVRNGSAVSTQEGHLSFRYSEYESSHWDTTHSWQVDGSFGIQTVASARLPLLKFIRIGVETTITLEVSAGYQGEHNVGETKVEESEMTTSFTLRIPPMTESLVNMVVSRAKIQLPYSYTQREMLQDGSSESIKKHDGLYEGEGTYVDYDVQESKI